MTKAPLLEVKNLSIEFPTKRGTVKAVDGVSWTVDQGETLAILGESGSGKSVSSSAVMDLIDTPPAVISSGEILLRGVDLRDDFTGTDMRIAVRLEPMTLEEITRIWHALQRPYQLSVSYEMSLASIAPGVQPADVAPVLMADPRVSVIVGDAP